MFFRREKPRQPTFDDYLSRLREAGFSVQADGSGRVQVSKHGCSAFVQDRGEDHPGVGNVGVVAAGEVALLVHGGYQQFFVTPSGKKLPALAQQLRALHDFREDLKQALGLPSYYNESLGTISAEHRYDRVKGRDTGAPPNPSY